MTIIIRSSSGKKGRNEYLQFLITKKTDHDEKRFDSYKFIDVENIRKMIE